MNLQERLDYLNIDSRMEEQIRSLPFKIIDESLIRTDNELNYEKIINLSDLVGTSRLDVSSDNWIDYLGSLHKMRNFNYPVETYHRVLINPSLLDPPSVYLPDVIYNEGKYYINGEGKHRLTIGKCIGATKAKVTVTEYSTKV
ncbi:hypothetical protein [Bacillus infantis]|uniref:hypothetical protein n=1 Tax=Bacillus infantis TaxID=324767 RepID=UPI003CF8F03D